VQHPLLYITIIDGPQRQNISFGAPSISAGLPAWGAVILDSKEKLALGRANQDTKE
jgi:hypothetical protein